MTGHRRTFDLLWSNLVKLIQQLGNDRCFIAIEWPRGCSYWLLSRVKTFITRHTPTIVHFDRCMFGLKDKGGGHIRKPWKVVTNLSTLVDTLGYCCDGTHEHTRCTGTLTKSTETYPPLLTKGIHDAIQLHNKKHTTVAAAKQQQCAMAAAILPLAMDFDWAVSGSENASFGDRTLKRLPEDSIISVAPENQTALHDLGEHLAALPVLSLRSCSCYTNMSCLCDVHVVNPTMPKHSRLTCAKALPWVAGHLTELVLTASMSNMAPRRRAAVAADAQASSPGSAGTAGAAGGLPGQRACSLFHRG